MLQIQDIYATTTSSANARNSGKMHQSDANLVAQILGAGAPCSHHHDRANIILPLIDSGGELSTADLLNNSSLITAAEANLFAAALEFTRRRIHPAAHKIREPRDVANLLQHLSDRMQEYFICISLNGAHEVIASRVVTIGLLNSTQVHPREVFCSPLSDRACAIIVAHNHPSGNVNPSDEDRRVTKILAEAGAIIGIKLLDHIIFSADKFFSFADAGLLAD